MQFTLLGRTGITVSRLCFGTMTFGSDSDEATSGSIFARCLDAGINFFDTANTYSQGRSEEILGRLMKGKRDELIIASKVRNAAGPGPNDRGLSRRHIMMQIERSLRRLQTDRLDLYFVHSFDANTPMDETLHAMNDLVRQGKILHPAVSNWSAWQIAKGLGISERHDWARFECIQPMYSLLKRQAEVEILPLAQSEQVGVISYSPLAGGILTGKYGGRLPDQNRFLANPSYLKRYSDPLYQEVTVRFLEYTNQQNIHPATLAVAWVMAHPGITAPIVGARNVEQLETSLAAADIKLDAEHYAAVSALSYDPPSPTDRSEDRTK